MCARALWAANPGKTPTSQRLATCWSWPTGKSSWLNPTLLGQPPEFDGCCPTGWAPGPCRRARDGCSRLGGARCRSWPAGAHAGIATWYAVYYLARSPQAQPVAFAFGGEANPTDYARAMADGGLLALIACLGLAQLSHETTPALAQLAFTTLESSMAWRPLPWPTPWQAPAAGLPGLAGLALSGRARHGHPAGPGRRGAWWPAARTDATAQPQPPLGPGTGHRHWRPRPAGLGGWTCGAGAWSRPRDAGARVAQHWPAAAVVHLAGLARWRCGRCGAGANGSSPAATCGAAAVVCWWRGGRHVEHARPTARCCWACPPWPRWRRLRCPHCSAASWPR
jgi:hypothetical protein